MFLKILIFCSLLTLAISHDEDKYCFDHIESSSTLLDDFEFPKINFILTQQRETPIGGFSYITEDVRTDQVTLRKNTTEVIEYNSTIDSALSYNSRELFLTFNNNTLDGVMAEIHYNYYNETSTEEDSICHIHSIDMDVHADREKWFTFFEEKISGPNYNTSRDLLKLQILDQYIPVGPEEDFDCIEIATYPKYDLNLPQLEEAVNETTSFRLIHIQNFTDTDGNVQENVKKEFTIHLKENETQVVEFAQPMDLIGFQSKNPRNLTITLLTNNRVSAIIGLMKQNVTRKSTTTWECNIKFLEFNVQNSINLDFYIGQTTQSGSSTKAGLYKNYIRIEKDQKDDGPNGGSMIKFSNLIFVMAFCLKLFF